DADAGGGIGQWIAALLDGRDELTCEQGQRLGAIEPRRVHVTRPVGHQDLALRLVVGHVEVDAFVVHPHLLARLHVVVDEHGRTPTSRCRIFTGASQLTWKCARKPSSKCTVRYAMFSWR